MLGLRRTQFLHLGYPEFTLENLALLSEEYDFVAADRALHRCDRIEDAASEIMRVLRPGGWFVLTTCLIDLDSSAGMDLRLGRPKALEGLFPPGASIAAHGWGNLAGHALASWVVGQKVSPSPEIVPTVATRASRWRPYRFKPRAAKIGVTAMARNEAP